MKIKFKKKRIYINFILGAIWLIIGVFKFIDADKIKWSDYAYIVLGILYIGHNLYDLINQYITIENGTIQKNKLYGFNKSMKLKEIDCIKKYAGDYTLKTPERELKISTQLIDKDSLHTLNKILSALDLPSDKTPFSNAK